jgi:two-component system chemotaxis response regulator CheY
MINHWWWIAALGGGYQPCMTAPLDLKTPLMREILANSMWPCWHAHCDPLRAKSKRADDMQPNLSTKEGAMSDERNKSGFFMSEEACEGRVLVVDDEPDIRKVVRMTLQKAGYEVLEAENGEKAIEVINSGENRLLLDVVICDIRMPKINGAEAIAYFRSNYPRVPLIVLTGFPDTDMATSFLRQGVVDYLVKPVEGEKLRSAVARAMEQRELARL